MAERQLNGSAEQVSERNLQITLTLHTTNQCVLRTSKSKISAPSKVFPSNSNWGKRVRICWFMEKTAAANRRSFTL
jgi:hypothetical protein